MGVFNAPGAKPVRLFFIKLHADVHKIQACGMAIAYFFRFIHLLPADTA
jgi:hypothetical protein